MTIKYANDPGTGTHAEKPLIARIIHAFAVPIILGWIAICVALSVFIPSLEEVGQERSVSLSPKEAPSYQAMKHIGQAFNEGNTDSVAMIVLEGKQPLGDEAHKYYDALIRKLRADTKHVQSVQDFWGDPLTAAGAQSNDGKATYVQLNLAGNQGEPLANESVEAVRKIVADTPRPPGITTYVTGAAALVADMHHSGDKSMVKITITTVVVIFVMLLLVYRSPITVIMLLLTVGVELTAARGVVALLGHTGAIGLSTFAVSLLTSLAIAAGTDYGIFIFGRYQEARQAGEDRETAFYTMYRGTAHVILGSGLTIAGATFCLKFARMPYFETLGIPCAVGMLVAVFAALTLGPAVLTVGSRFGLFDPKRLLKVRGWRRVGTVVVRWPLPVLAATCAVALVGLLALPGYRTNYNDRSYLPNFIPANEGFAAAERHFSQARMKPDVLMIESDHDMRNPADFLVLDRLAKGIFRVPGISRVQAITRPDGTAMDHTSIPFLISMQNAGQVQTLKYQRDRIDDMLKQADEMAKTITIMKQMYSLMSQLAENTHRIVGDTEQMQQITNELRDHIADFDDFWRPIRSYFYWEKHCYDIPICWSFRSIFDALDGLDQVDEKLGDLVADTKNIDRLMPQMLATFPPMIDSMESMRIMMLTMHSTMAGFYDQMNEMSENSTAMGKAFDAAKNDDSFYLPPEVFKNKDFQRAMKSFLSPDGHSARFIILHRGDPQSPEGIASVNAIRTAAEESLKGTPLEDAKIYLAGTAAVFYDIADGAKWDLLIAGISSLCLIFIIMLILTRAFVAAAVIVGTVALSLGASFGLSVLLWQHILSIELHYMVLAMSVIVLLAVGSDYNLLLVSRFKEEIGAGLNTGIIRAMGGTGKVVTNAGLVFAFTMASMAVSDLRVIGQVGTTIGLGLLFDTLIVRSFMTPSIAALLGRWFWWPMKVRSRPARIRSAPRGPGEEPQTDRLMAMSGEH
ncbi:MMPL/RND family transporter [Mycobacterium kansasii]|uniref:Membrane transport protein mmpL8 n=4 Tax=Mycobacterium kansasii TaxID=1768 RepID=A0A653EMH9_MYCKA|nr:RND family transporter [Mycobacterium kansasii]EUA02979.1 transport family protein [Mycobacterium kansasii 824]AGZ54319.1 membrane protein [Mycobacterium kansasii ATCC 12478]ARG56307.1 MMPL family RND transporter [Mycobacterium kansasii]ARG61757.1 MMPL family RND transporter [Mycobacterium kansasii]ARG69439.1 MMPL family RND transporter [Mycobacterium kansasii]